MREIKLHLWDKKKKQMWYNGFYLQFNPLSIWMDTEDGLIELPRKEFIILHYIGLKDKNEEKLYEYDLIAHYENGSICSPRGVIIFNDGSFKAKFVGGKSYTILNQRTTRHFIKLGNAYADKETALTMGIDCIYYD